MHIRRDVNGIMTEKQYKEMADKIRAVPGLLPVILMLNRILTAIGFIAYPALLLKIGFDSFGTGRIPGLLIWYIAGPSAFFVLLSLYRRKKDVPRPYQALNIDPLIHKETMGRSFPSRHIFSLAMIALLWYPFSLPLSLALIVSTILLAVIRVASGVHYIRDVIIGGLIGILCGVFIDLGPFI